MFWIAIIVAVLVVYALFSWAEKSDAEDAAKRMDESRGSSDMSSRSTMQTQRQNGPLTVTVGIEAPNRHEPDPRCMKPVKGLSEYVSIYSSAFLPIEHQLDLVTVNDDGTTNLKLELYNGQYVLEAPNGLIPNTASAQVYKLGIFNCPIRGSSYYEDAIMASDTRPLRKAKLVREYDNKYDRNAVAIYGDGGLIGYVNKQNAARLAKRIDSGEEYLAVFTCGDGYGRDEIRTSVLIAPVETMRSIFENSGLMTNILR